MKVILKSVLNQFRKIILIKKPFQYKLNICLKQLKLFDIVGGFKFMKSETNLTPFRQPSVQVKQLFFSSKFLQNCFQSFFTYIVWILKVDSLRVAVMTSNCVSCHRSFSRCSEFPNGFYFIHRTLFDKKFISLFKLKLNRPVGGKDVWGWVNSLVQR